MSPRNGRTGGKPPTAKLVTDTDWLKQCVTFKNGTPMPTLANAMRALRLDPALTGLLGYDEMLRSAMLMKPLCVDGRYDAEYVPRPITDEDVFKLQEWLQIAGLSNVAKDVMHSAVALRASEHSYHPLRDDLDRLKWDGHFRLDNWLATYLGAEPSDYTARIGRMFLISMVARIYDPGCKADHMIVLEGEQGTLKSTACEVLGRGYFSDSLPDIHNKDASMHLRGKWLIEIAEMHTFDKVESAKLKAFVSRTDERYRPSYGRCEVHEPRQCLFIGTTNKSIYLKDETGGRRFWPVKTGTIDIDALIRDCDQLFAEAIWHLNKGIQWWPDKDFEREYIMPEQDLRYEPDVWQGRVADYLMLNSRITIGMVLDAIGIKTERQGRADQNRAITILEGLGWRREREGRKKVKDLQGKTWWVRKSPPTEGKN